MNGVFPSTPQSFVPGPRFPHSLRRRLPRLISAPALVATLAGAAYASPLTFYPPLDIPGPFMLWDMSTTVRSDLGYRDNVLQAATNAHPSAFVGLGADIFVFRLPRNDVSFNLFFSAEDRRYLDAADGTTNLPGVVKAQSFITHGSLKKSFSDGWSVSLKALHYYVDEVFDASDIENGIGSVHAQGHQFSLTPGVRRDFSGRWWAEVTFPVTRQIFAEPISSYWEGGPRLGLGWSHRTNSSIELTLGYATRPYDDRFQLSMFGDPYPALSLTMDEFKSELAWKETWDAAKRWSTIAKCFFTRRLDNGEGWYDVDRMGVSLATKFETKRWVVRGTARWNTSDFPLQMASPFDPSLRTRDEVELEGRIEYHFEKHWTLYGSYLHEWVRSNVRFDAYRSNTAFGGVEFEF